jgi:hypothetical protein
MLIAILVSVLLQSQVSVGQPPPAANLIRLCVLPAARTNEAADLFESAKDLSAAFATRKKDLAVVATPEHADVVVTVTNRTVTIPKIAIGVVPENRPGAPASGPVRMMHVRITLAAGKDEIEINSKESALEPTTTWKLAAEDVVKQVEKWIADHKAALMANR